MSLHARIFIQIHPYISNYTSAYVHKFIRKIFTENIRRDDRASSTKVLLRSSKQISFISFNKTIYDIYIYYGHSVASTIYIYIYNTSLKISGWLGTNIF